MISVLASDCLSRYSISAARKACVDSDKHCAHLCERELKHDPLRDVRRPQRHAVAALYAEAE